LVVSTIKVITIKAIAIKPITKKAFLQQDIIVRLLPMIKLIDICMYIAIQKNNNKI